MEKRKRECEVLKDSDVASKKAKAQRKGHPLILLCPVHFLLYKHASLDTC